jgi:hypothetical protein
MFQSLAGFWWVSWPRQQIETPIAAWSRNAKQGWRLEVKGRQAFARSPRGRKARGPGRSARYGNIPLQHVRLS